jgi:hypothetical protein
MLSTHDRSDHSRTVDEGSDMTERGFRDEDIFDTAFLFAMSPPLQRTLRSARGI